MEVKIKLADQTELDNLDMQLQLDSKLRALEIAVKFTKDPSRLFSEGV